MAKLTEADKRYQQWVAERDAPPPDPEPTTQKVTVGGDDAVVVIRNFKHGETLPEIEVAFDGTKYLNEAGLLAIGITRCLQDEAWRTKLLMKTHKFVSDELRKNREEEM